MKRILAAVAILSALPAAAAAWAPDAQLQRQLLRGGAWAEVLPSTEGAGLIHAAVDIDAPPRTVWAVMTDCRMAARVVTTVISCRVVQGDLNAGWDVREHVTKGNFFVPQIRNVFRSDYQPYSLIRFHRTSGDLKIEEGEWRLVPINGGAGTQLVYVNRVAANILAPAFLVRASLRRDTPKALENLRRESVAAARRASASAGEPERLGATAELALGR